MAPIKFEDQIKEQLDKREIQPSAGSWDRLSAELDKTESAAGKRRWWPGIAAAVAALLVLGTFIFREAEVSAPEVVEEPAAREEFQKPAENVQFQPAEELASKNTEEHVMEEAVKEPVNEGEIAETKAEEPLTQPVKKTEKSRPVILESIAMNPPEEVREEIIASKNTSAAVAETSEKENAGITDAEVDALLARASERISREKKASSAEKITAGALLSDMETSEDESTKAKVFQLIKEGYMKAKTAVVQRNE